MEGNLQGQQSHWALFGYQTVLSDKQGHEAICLQYLCMYYHIFHYVYNYVFLLLIAEEIVFKELI